MGVGGRGCEREGDVTFGLGSAGTFTLDRATTALDRATGARRPRDGPATGDRAFARAKEPAEVRVGSLASSRPDKYILFS